MTAIKEFLYLHVCYINTVLDKLGEQHGLGTFLCLNDGLVLIDLANKQKILI